MTAAPLIFETAWEVCNQVGGIYTVLKTKAPAMLSRLGNNYILLGPYNPESATVEFEGAQPEEPLVSALVGLQNMGIKAYYGRWLIKGRPQVILFDYRGRYNQLHDDKYFLWKDHGLSTPNDDYEINNSIAFGFVVAEFFRLLNESAPRRPIIAHFHEWQAGIGILRTKFLRLPVSCIFTTHATLLGRYMAGDNPNFYYDLEHTEPFSTARHYNIEPRYLIERWSAHAADFFTTISEVTAYEAERLLGRKPDHLLPNGINIERFTALHEFQNLHRTYKERLNQFVMGHFFPSYTFDLDRTLYLFTSGRYEYRNKGMDFFIESLFRLNQRLKSMPNPPTVVAFIITRAPYRSVNVGALQRRQMLEDLKTVCVDLQDKVGERVLHAVARGQLPKYEDLLPNEFQVQLKRAIHARRRGSLPAIVTHDLWDDAKDPVLAHLRHRGLINDITDPVKVVFHPDFVTSTGAILNLDYDNFVRGCHMGVFPSYYEPWGYTPLESLALGIPTVTSDLTGFGHFSVNHISNPSEQGLYVIRRHGRDPNAAIDDLTNILFNFSQLSRRERIELRNRAEKLSDLFDWNKLAEYYHNVHEVAALRYQDK
jgi:glycogen(starch) synthase